MNKIKENKYYLVFYDVRALIYTLLIGVQLLFLLSLRDIGFDNVLFYIFASTVFFIVTIEFVFSMYYSGRIYHKEHTLRNEYKKLRRRHLFNIILLPIVQYISCVVIIYLNLNIAGNLDIRYLNLINLFSILITLVLTYLTFLFYKQVYANDLKINNFIEEFFDFSKYISFTFLAYIVFVLQRMEGMPRSFSAIAIGMIQVVYLFSVLWRRFKLTWYTSLIALALSFLTSGLIYLLLLIFNNYTIGIVGILTAQAVIIDYVITSLLIRWVQKNLTLFMFSEYLLVAMISALLLYTSKM